MNAKDIKALFESWMTMVTPCGSRVTCNPPPVDTDEDWLVYTDARPYEDALIAAGFVPESGDYDRDDSKFESWRKGSGAGSVNLIITRDAAFADRHCAATHVCTQLNLLDKEARKCVFQAVLYGNHYVSKELPQ